MAASFLLSTWFKRNGKAGFLRHMPTVLIGALGPQAWALVSD